MSHFRKYPRTNHLEGSSVHQSDRDLDLATFKALKGRYVVVEEKLDGANSGVSFNQDGELLLQSRGHILRGGGRERHFSQLKAWAPIHQDAFWKILGDRYVMYGEWMQAKHTVFYDNLPHLFMEFDVLDKDTGIFLSTLLREKLLQSLPIASVPVLWSGKIESYEPLLSLIGPSRYKTEAWDIALANAADDAFRDIDEVMRETEHSNLMEGLYIKIEEDDQVVERFKYVRPGFVQTVMDAEDHWMDRTIVENRLAAGVDMWK